MEERPNHPTLRSLHAAIQARWPDVSVGYSTVTQMFRKPHWSPKARDHKEKPGPRRDEGLTERIIAALEKTPTLSARQLALHLGEPPSTVKSYLHDVLGFEFKRTRWVPHLLSPSQKKSRIQLSQSLLKEVEDAEKHSFRFFCTGDESWFFYETPLKGLWLPPDEEPPEGQKATHFAPKTMVTIFWNPDGIVLIRALPAGEKWSGEYFINNILKPMMKTEAYKDAKRENRKLTLHMDNARVHTASIVRQFMQQNGFAVAPHPAYSPDLAPSDFYLFGALKSRITGRVFASSDEIIEWITREFQRISPDELERAFQEWKQRLARCSKSDGSYIR